jgi:hypothetical protein
MRIRTNRAALNAAGKAEIFSFSIYIIFSLLAFISYGYDIKPSIFTNINEDGGALSIIVRLLFLLLFYSSLSFLFMICKDTFLTLILEIKQREVSKAIIK